MPRGSCARLDPAAMGWVVAQVAPPTVVHATGHASRTPPPPLLEQPAVAQLHANPPPNAAHVVHTPAAAAQLPGGRGGRGAAESPPAIFDSLVTADQSLAAALQPLADSTGQSSMAAAAADGARIAAAVAGAQSPHLRPPSQPQPPSQPHPPSQQQPTLQLSSQHVAPAAVRPPGLGFSGGIDRIPNCLGGGGFGGGPPPDSSNASSASASPGPLQNSPATLHSFVSRSSATACGGGGLGVSGSGGGTGSATDAKSGMAIVPLSDVPVPSLLHNPRDTPPPLKPLCAFPNYPLLLLELIPCRPGVQCPTISPPFMSLAPPLTLLDDTWQVCCPTKLASPSPPPARGR